MNSLEKNSVFLLTAFVWTFLAWNVMWRDFFISFFLLSFLTIYICLGKKCMTMHVWDYSSFGHVFFSPCSLDRPISKRCASLSTCVLGKLSQELHKLQTYPRTDVGAGTPGKKRNVLSDLEHERYANYGEPLGNN